MTDDQTPAAAILALTHWLVFDDDRSITGCHCGFRADPGDESCGDSVVGHLFSTAEQAARAEILGHVNRAALSAADLAFMETPGSNMDKVGAAIDAYLWSQREAKPWGDTDLFVYPSLKAWREYVAAKATP